MTAASAFTGDCGPHCGIAGSREGHCDCGLCHDGTAPAVTLPELTARVPRIPMCARWYERAGAFRPWLPERPEGVPDFPERHMTRTSGRPEHHELCDYSICHPDCPVRRGAEMEHWREARKIIDTALAAQGAAS